MINRLEKKCSNTLIKEKQSHCYSAFFVKKENIIVK